jgi:DNA-binding beta-propeller fold protein YncE
VVVFDRNAGSGALSQKLGPAGCLTEETALISCSGAAGIVGSGFESAVSPDGRHVYVSNESPGGVAMFNRASDGTLAQSPGTGEGCVTVGGTSGATGGAECAAGPASLAEGRGVNLDPQGAFLIASAAGGNTLFRRDATTGRLTQAGVSGVAGSDAAFTPDGTDVVLNAGGAGLSFFTLDRATGKLSQRVTQLPAILAGLGGVTVSSNGMYVFAAFRAPPANGGSVASFERDVSPRCQSKAITLRRRKPVVVPLTCTDANDDQITLAIAAPPVYGTLGRVDQTNDRVLYTPDPRRKGKDPFKYRGTARGSSGPAATVTINVLAPPAKRDRRPPNTRITSGPPTTTSARTARFKFRSSERGSDFQCKPDWRKRWASCRSPKSYANLRRGRHSFRVRAIDPAGNVDRTPAKRDWTVR